MRKIELKEMQRIELDLLLELDRVCRANGLRYYMDGGTLLGALCYDGFIPWDDDIDIKMPRPDYERLMAMQNEFPEHILLDAPRAEHCEYAFLKLIDRRTVLAEEFGEQTKTTGVYLDVLPMDGHPEDAEERSKHLARLSRLNSLFHTSQTSFSELCGSKTLMTRIKGAVYRMIWSPWRLYQRLTETAKKYSYDQAKQVGLLVEGDPLRERFEKSWLEPPAEMLFEGHYFPAPNAAEEHLSIFYRKPISRDLYYQKLPKIDSTHRHQVYWKE